jgi:hypothetical protein
LGPLGWNRTRVLCLPVRKESRRSAGDF